MTQQAKSYYSAREFAYRLNLFPSDVTKACKAGIINATKNEKGRWEIPESEIVRIRKKLRQEAISKHFIESVQKKADEKTAALDHEYATKKQNIIGTLRRFGEMGIVYQVLAIIDDSFVKIRVLDTNEETSYPLEEAFLDPLAE